MNPSPLQPFKGTCAIPRLGPQQAMGRDLNQGSLNLQPFPWGALVFWPCRGLRLWHGGWECWVFWQAGQKPIRIQNRSIEC